MEILIVEDEVASRKKLKFLAEKIGYTVTSAENGLEAWQLWQKRRPGIVITDWMMPEMDGLALCTRIRQQPGEDYTYIIIVTGMDTKQNIVEGMKAGADDYITKPFSRDELEIRIRAGERILQLQKEEHYRKKFQGALEMAGAVCHEINQPLQVIQGYSELMIGMVTPDSPYFQKIDIIRSQVEKIGRITRKLMQITRYETREYIHGRQIIDIEKATENWCMPMDLNPGKDL